MSASPDPQSQLLSEILVRAARDPEFRASLLQDPAAVIQKEFGLQIPAGYRVQFIEKEDGVDALVVLPDAAPSDELSDEQLEDVAGGADANRGPGPRPPTFWAH